MEDINYFKTIERYLCEFAGIEINFEKVLKRWNEETKIEGNILIDYPDSKQFLEDLFENMFRQLLPNVLLKNQWDWELFEKLKVKLATNFVFGKELDNKKDYKRIQFLKDLVSIAHKTYEGANTNVGVIYSSKDNLDYLEKHYNFKFKRLENNLSVKELFEREKPLLKLVDGETLNLLINEEYKVYGFALNVKGKDTLSECIIQDFENVSLINSLNLLKKYINNQYEEIMKNLTDQYHNQYKNIKSENNEVLKKLVETIGELIKIIVKNASPRFESKSLDIIYFKLSGTELSIYNQKDFVVSFTNGEWKLKNYHLLRFIIMKQLLSRTHTKLFSEKYGEESELLSNVLQGTKVLINTLKKLSVTNTSSILLVLNDATTENVYTTELNRDEAKKSLLSAPLKKSNSNYSYLDLILDGDVHINLKDVSSDFIYNLCSIDGALVLDDKLNVLSFGEIIETNSKQNEVFGTGTNACKVSSENKNLAIKVSEDGDIKVYSDGELILAI